LRVSRRRLKEARGFDPGRVNSNVLKTEKVRIEDQQKMRVKFHEK